MATQKQIQQAIEVLEFWDRIKDSGYPKQSGGVLGEDTLRFISNSNRSNINTFGQFHKALKETAKHCDWMKSEGL